MDNADAPAATLMPPLLSFTAATPEGSPVGTARVRAAKDSDALGPQRTSFQFLLRKLDTYEDPSSCPPPGESWRPSHDPDPLSPQTKLPLRDRYARARFQPRSRPPSTLGGAFTGPVADVLPPHLCPCVPARAVCRSLCWWHRIPHA
jgi:hypothetical protein